MASNIISAWPLRVNQATTINLSMFSDITPTACLSYEYTGIDNATITFAADLTDDQVYWVKLRMETVPEEEQLYRDARLATAQIRTYIALAAPTNAQVAAQVKLLSRVSEGLIKLAVRLPAA